MPTAWGTRRPVDRCFELIDPRGLGQAPASGGGFRITGPRTGGWVLGHGNGGTDGCIPNDGRLYNC